MEISMFLLRLSIAAAFFALTLSACNNKEQDTATPKTTSHDSNQNQEQPKASARKTVRIEEIDFSKYPGVIKPAAFGYYFGLTKEQIEDSGIELYDEQESDTMASANTTSAPIPWADAEFYVLRFYKQKLLSISAVGKDITNDATGSEGRAKYKELRDSLTEKYGKASKSMHSVGNNLWKETDEFYQCLAYDGCGVWGDIWKGDEKEIVIELKGPGTRGKGYIVITYESKPEWRAAIDAQAAKNKIKTLKGL